MQKITGRYAMEAWNENALRDRTVPQKCSTVEAHGPMTGGLAGAAQTFYLLAYVTEKVGAFSGYTYFEGALDGREGGFVLADEGTFDETSATTCWTIVEGSGTAALEGISGTGGFRATNGLTVDFTLEYEIGGRRTARPSVS